MITRLPFQRAMEGKQFDWIEYIVFAMTLGVSTLIGVFFCYHRGGQRTAMEYLLGDKRMPLLPTAVSLVAGSMSGVTLLGLPSEVYHHGAHFMLGTLSLIGVALVTLFIFLPVFYNLQVISLYEYLELRFNNSVRKMASLFYIIFGVMFLPFVIYGPALAFSQVSKLDVHVITVLVSTVCIFYTTVGGLKAVVWTDSLQGIIMLGAVLTVFSVGVSKVGGIGAVYSIAKERSRLDIFNLDPDPTVRLTLWTSTFGLFFQWGSLTATNPTVIQRFISLPMYKQAQQAVILFIVGVLLFTNFSVLMGLVIFATYKDCDPISSKLVKFQDQIFPYYVLDVAGHMKGLPGLFVGGIVAAALSTMSTNLHTLSGVIYGDFVRPFFGDLSERKAGNVMKLISLTVGVLCTGLVAVIEKMGGIIDMTNRVFGITNGVVFGIFFLGVLVPQVNSIGVLVGGTTGLIVMFIVAIGSKMSGATYPSLPTSNEMCYHNFTVVPKEFPNQSEIFTLFRVSFFWYGAMGFAIMVAVGLVVSFLVGPNNPGEVDPSLLSPLVRRFLPKTTDYSSIPLKEDLAKKGASAQGGNLKE